MTIKNQIQNNIKNYTKKNKKKIHLLNKTKKGGNNKKCFIEDLTDGNIRIIKGRRRYITKNFNINSNAKKYIYDIANNIYDERNCIKVARLLDIGLKNIKNNQKK